MVHLRGDSKYLLKTTKGDTYSKALALLRQGMPKAGFLQAIRNEEINILKNDNYTKKIKQHKRLTADVDMWFKYECKYQGEFYITAVIAKEDIKYFSLKYPKEFKLKNLKRTCNGEKIFVVAVAGYKFEISGDKRIRHEDPMSNYVWYLYCGRTEYKNNWKWGKYTRSNRFEDFVVIVSHRGKIQEATTDFWLEITKNL